MPFYLEMSINITQQRDIYDSKHLSSSIYLYTSIYIYLSIYLSVYLYTYIYDSQVVHHNPCFNVFILHNNSSDNRRRKVNKNDIFLRYASTFLSFTKTVFLLHIQYTYVALVLDSVPN